MVQKHRTIKLIAVIAGLLIVTIAYLFPVYWILLTSFKLPNEIFVETPIFFLRTLHLDNYYEIFQKSLVLTYFANSTVVAVSTTLATIVLATLAGYGIARSRARWAAAIRNSVIVIRMIPAIMYTIPLYLIYNEVGLIDTKTGLVLAYVTFSLPLAIWLSVTFYHDIPEELFESAEIDGCTEWEVYSRIALPLIVPGIAVMAILVFIGAWNEFGLALVLQYSDENKTIPIGIASMVQTHKDTPSGSLAAAGMLAIIPAILISLTTQKYIVKGLMAGAVKG
jgi:ABC-type glycerol-3-phosphate transport system permease component